MQVLSLGQEDLLQPTPVFLPWKSRGQRSLVGYSPWGRRESDMTEQLSVHAVLSRGFKMPALGLSPFTVCIPPIFASPPEWLNVSCTSMFMFISHHITRNSHGPCL